MNALPRLGALSMKRLKQTALLASAVVLTACATATPYQPSLNADARNGFSEMKIEDDRVRVSFDGNSLTDRNTVETYLLYRAAELTKQAGYDYFMLTDRAVDEKSRLVSTGFEDPYYGFFDYSYFHPRHGWSRPHYRNHFRSHFGYRDSFYSGFGYSSFGHSPFGRSAFGHSSFGWGNDFEYREVSRYKASAEVKFGRGAKPENAQNAFWAQGVLDNLGDKIVYPEVKS